MTTPNCTHCNDTGRLPGSDHYDCGYCHVATERVEMNAFADGIATSSWEDSNWRIHQRAKALGRASALAELHPNWLAEKERADRAEARIAELEAQIAAASAPADTDKLREAIADELHNAIMNLRCSVPRAVSMHGATEQAYKEGHRDARHAAAELVGSTALQAPVREVPEGMEDPILVPRGLIGAACYLIRKHAPESTLLPKLRAFTICRTEEAAPVQQEGE